MYATTLRPEQDYHRLYMRIALDGTLTKFHEETEDCGIGIMINAIFEFPEGNRFGEYRNSYRVPGYIALRPRLFSFDDDFVFDTLHEYGNILQTLGDTVHSILHNASGNGTVRVFNDSILLFSFATNEGGCIVTGGTHDDASSRFDLFVLKINADGTVGTDEILVQEIRPYAYWPNPAQDELHLQFSPDVTPKSIELYDLQGRLVQTQSKNLESLNMAGLPAGTYMMRVMLEDGKVFSDKVVKE